jgi:predicted permease
VGICAAILLIGCVNLASLLLARRLRRRREIAVRLALGAKRSHVAWLFATESFLLAAAGGLVGFLLAQGLDQWLMAVGDRVFGNFDLSLAFDWRIGIFLAIALAAIAGGFAAASAWQADSLQGSEALKEGGRGIVGSNSASQKILIALQVALTLTLVAVSGLFGASLKKFYEIHLGVDTRNVWDVALSTRPGVKGHFETGPYYRELLREVKSMPEVKSAVFADWIPFFATGGEEAVSVLDIGKAQREIQATVLTNSAEFAHTLGMKMVAGDGFGSDDQQSGEPAVIVSESLAERLGNHPRELIGHHLRIGVSSGYERLQISGVVSNAQTDMSKARQLAPFVAYVNIWQHPDAQRYPVLLLKTIGNGLNVDSLRRIVNARGREYVDRVRTLADEKDGALMEDRMLASLSGAFSALALMMAGTGLFGLLSYQVGNRTGEIGIRMALGAERRQIRWLILRQIVTVIAVGGGLGLILSIGVGKAIAGILFDVSPYSPALLTVSYLVLTATALLAAWLPVRRATSIDPVIALRHE